MATADQAFPAPAASETPRSERGFWALIATQFQGAYSDNILRNLLLAMIVGMGLGKNQRDTFVSIVTFLFSMPFVLFSMTGGWLADRFSKRQVTIWTKVMEIGAMSIATIGLATHQTTLALRSTLNACLGSPKRSARIVWAYICAGTCPIGGTSPIS